MSAISAIMGILDDVANEPFLLALFALVLSFVFGLGQRFGIPDLLRHHKKLPRLVNAMSIGALLAWVAFLAHIPRWQTWAFESAFVNLLDWHEGVAWKLGIPPHGAYFCIYMSVMFASALPIAAIFLLLDRPLRRTANMTSRPRSPFRWCDTAEFVLLVALGIAAVASLVMYAANVLKLYQPAEDGAASAGPWPSGTRTFVAFAALLIALVVSLAAIVPIIRCKSPRIPAVAVLALVAAGLAAIVSGSVPLAALSFQEAAHALGVGHGQARSVPPKWQADSSGISTILLPVVFLLVIVVSGLRRYRVRLPSFPGNGNAQDNRLLREAYEKPASKASEDVKLLPALPDFSKMEKGKPLVVIAASGGGLTAAVWTFEVLCRLEKRCGTQASSFFESARLITGASGGMLGAAYYTALASTEGGRVDPDSMTFRCNIAKDCLSPVMRVYAFHDLFWSMFPMRLRYDRGQSLERAWSDNLDKKLDLPLSELVSGEERGSIPSLVFSPMMVENGKRLIVSNRDFSWLEGYQPGSFEEFFKWFPTLRTSLRISTATRMSATFPLISPSISIPSDPPRMVVDAGYFDNYGVHLAAAWIRHLVHELQREGQPVPPIALIEVRAYPPTEPRESGLVVRGCQDLLSPILALGTARSAVTAYRNREQVEQLKREFEGSFEAFEFCCKSEFPLNWFLSPKDAERIRGDFDDGELNRFCGWWNRRRAPDRI